MRVCGPPDQYVDDMVIICVIIPCDRVGGWVTIYV